MYKESPHTAAGLGAGLPDQAVVWNTEPVEYAFRFTIVDGRTRLEVRRFSGSRRQASEGEVEAVVEGDAAAVARALGGGLRRLQGAVPAEEFAAAWRHPFPAAAVGQLRERLRG